MKVAFGKTLERDIDPTRYGFPPESELSPVAQHVIYIGLRNIGMDSHANDTEDKHGSDYIKFAGETLDKKLAALANGDVRVAGTRSTDPIGKQMRLLAVAKANKELKAELGKAFKDLDSAVLTARVHKILVDNDAAYRKLATKMVKDMAALEII